MIEPRQALIVHLRADTNVTKTLKKGANSIYQRRVPAGAAKPLVVIWPTISRVPNRILDGVSYQKTRLQVTAIADTQPEVEKAVNAVIKAIDGFTGLMAEKLNVILATVDNDRQVDQDGADEIHHHVDVMITYTKQEEEVVEDG